MKVNIEKEYEKYHIQIDNCLSDVPEEMRATERKRILNDLYDVINNSVFLKSEYFMYDFAHKNRVEQSTFLPDKSTYEIFYRLNDCEKTEYNTRNKWDVYKHLKQYYRREICLVTGPEHKDAFFRLLKDKNRLFCKPLCGSLGEQIKIIRDKDMLSEKAFFELLEYYSPEGFLAEELIQQTDFMNRLNPTSVNTLRVMTIRMDNRISLYFEFKIGEMFSIVDNLGKRSLICGVDESDGTIITAFNQNRTLYMVHPQTKVKVVGEKIPYFSQAIDLTIELARQFSAFRYLAWDLALTDEGWVVVELNGKGGICGFQEVYNTGIRRDIECYLTELNQSIEFEGILNEGYVPGPEGKMCPHLELPFSM